MFHLFLLISNLQTVFYLPKTLQTITFETLQPIPSDLYDHYQSSVDHAGTGKTSKTAYQNETWPNLYSNIGIGIDQRTYSTL